MTLGPHALPSLFPPVGLVRSRVARWPLTAHAGRVAPLAAAVAEHLGRSDVQVCESCRAGLLHDLGRAFVRQAVRRRTGPLTAQEWCRRQRHPLT